MSILKHRSDTCIRSLHELVSILDSYNYPVHSYNITITDNHIFVDIVIVDKCGNYKTVLKFSDLTDSIEDMVCNISNELLRECTHD